MAFFSWFLILCVNCGLLVGMVMGVLLLLRPVTVRLLTPGQRTFLWGAGWLMGFVPNWVLIYSLLPLPFPTFPDLVVPRAENGYPMFLPLIREAGDQHVALPGGAVVPVSISDGTIFVLGVLAILYLVGVFACSIWVDTRVRRLARSGEPLSREQYDSLGMEKDGGIIVRLCPNLPTSFVIRSFGKHEIALQRELSREQMRLVLLHEREHVNCHDPWLQGLMTTSLSFYFWNPILWAAYYFTRRDMELACDRRVLCHLKEEERRVYARTLVELASDKPVFGGLTTFGECDAALRVKAVAKWEPEDEADDLEPRRIIGWMVVITLIVVLMLGGPRDKVLPQDVWMDLGEIGAWSVLEQDLAEEGAVLASHTPVWMEGDETFASLYFQDSTGNWWQAMVRRYLYYGGVETHLSRCIHTPKLEGYVSAVWGQTE